MKSDDDLLREAVRGHRESLDELIVRDGAAVRRNLKHRIHSRWKHVLTEDDVLQQTWLDAVLFIERFEPRGIVTWLTNMARRNLIDAVRELQAAKRGGDRVRVTLDQGPSNESYIALFEQLAGNFTSPSQAAMANEARTELVGALQEIPESYRTVIEQYDLAGGKAVDVASACNCSVGAMHMRRSRGLAMLRSILRSGSRYVE